MDDPGRVRIGQRRQHLGDDADDARLRQGPLVGQQVVEVKSIHVLHGDEELAVLGHAEVEDVDGVGVVEAACGPGLALKARHRAGIREELLVQHLEHHGLVQHQLPGTVHPAHPTLADAALDGILAGHHLAHQGVAITGEPREDRAAGGAELRGASGVRCAGGTSHGEGRGSCHAGRLCRKPGAYLC